METKPIIPVAMIKQECDDEDVIDLDKYVPIKKEAEEWDSKVRSHLRDVTSFESERKLDSMMKWYIESLKNDASLLTDHTLVQSFIIKHMYTFKVWLVQLGYCYVDNYLDSMEEIMTFYSNLELKLLSQPEKHFKRQINQMCRRLIYYIKLYLLCRDDRALHVLMKMKVNENLNEHKDFMNHLYRVFLLRDPKDKTDLAFCRAYILFQQWKKIKNKMCWKTMDDMMYSFYGRTTQDIKSNETLKRIILPQNNSILDALAYIDNDHVFMVREYFKIIQPKNIQDISDFETDLALDEGIDPASDKTEEDPDLEEHYINYRESLTTVSSRSTGEVKEENDSDDDCQFVGILENAPEIIHEIPDDDDIADILILKENNTVPFKKKLGVDNSDLSFLDAISASYEHDISEIQAAPDEQNRVASDVPVIVEETDSWIVEYHNQKQAINRAEQPSSKHEIDKTLGNLLTPPSDDREYENVKEFSRGNSEAVLDIINENNQEINTQETTTGKTIMEVCPSVTSQSKDTSVIRETFNSPLISKDALCEQQSIGSKEKSNDFDSSDRIPLSTPTTTASEILPHMSESSNLSQNFSNSPSSSNLPNHTPRRNEDDSSNCPDISSTSIDIQENLLHYTGGSELFLENEQNTRNQNVTDITGSRENITQSHLDDENDITIEYPSLINEKELTIIAENNVSDDKVVPASKVIKPFCSSPTDSNHELLTKGTELSKVSEKINLRPISSIENRKSEHKIMYTQKPDTSTNDFCNLNSHKTWQGIKDTHEMDHIMSGPVENYVIESALPELDCDLFDTARKSTHKDMQITPTEIISPQYEEGLDDFIHYYGEKTKNNSLTVPAINQNLPSNSNLENNQRRLILKKFDKSKESKKTNATKVKRVTFDAKVLVRKEKPKMLISRKKMHMPSFKAAGVKPTDTNLQSIPVVIVEKLEEWEIEQWLKMSETSRSLRMERERLQALQTRTLQNTMFKIDYDKTEVSLTPQEVQQLHNNFLGRDNFKGAEVVNKSSATVKKPFEGSDTRHNSNGKRTKKYDNAVDGYDSALNPAKRKRGRRKKGT